jgi:hypothetical protein
MAQNRYIPFGYRIENGAIAVKPEEAEVVRGIYQRHAEEASYSAIAAELTAADIPYMSDKPVWNKNMVARILQNTNYLGEKKYPAILEPDEKCASQKAQKPYTITEPQEIKQIKGLLVCAICGEPVKRRLKSKGGERWFCSADPSHLNTSIKDTTLLKNVHAQLNQLISSPYIIARGTRESDRLSINIARLQNELDMLMKQEPLDIEGTKDCILRLATEKYALRDEDEETERTILKLLESAEPIPGLNTYLLSRITRRIMVGSRGEVALALKNGKIVGEGDMRYA